MSPRLRGRRTIFSFSSRKTAAVCSAVAYTFVEDPLALTFPLPALLWLGVLLSGVRAFRGFARWALKDIDLPFALDPTLTLYGAGLVTSRNYNI